VDQAADMTDRAAETGEGDSEPKGPLRRCLATREVKPKAELLRFVAGPDQRLVFDPAERLPGRGLWLSARRDIVETAVAKGLFSKAAGMRLSVPADMAGQVEGLLRERCLSLLGLARRAGQLRTGFEKVREELKAGRAAVLVAASDGAADGRGKLAALARGLPVIALFDSAELSAALGIEGVVHGCVAAGGMAERLLRECGRFQSMKTNGAADGSRPEK
jgi:predicted RNA-binding protein YlxR (DUF448 family)